MRSLSENNRVGITIHFTDGTSGIFAVTPPPPAPAMPAATFEVTYLRGGSVELEFMGVPNQLYSVERSTDLLNWSEIARPVAAPDGRVVYRDDDPPQSEGFYRFVPPVQ